MTVAVAAYEKSHIRVVRRLTGAAYLAIIVFSIAGYSTLTRLLAGQPQDVLSQVATSQTSLIVALAASVIGLMAWVAVGVLLYSVMASAGRTAGLLMLLFVAGGVGMNLWAEAQLVPLIAAPGVALDPGALVPIVDRYNRLLLLAQLFSGLWLFPFGWLILRSGAVARFLGICLLIGGFAYLLVFASAFAPFIADTAAYKVVSTVLFIVAMTGELGSCLAFLFTPGPPRLSR
jgi:hypothetical protein